MRLSNFLKDVPDDEYIFLGSASNYFFIGTKSDFWNDLKMLDCDFKRIVSDSKNKYCNDLEFLKANESDSSKKRIREVENLIDKKEKYLANYISISDREVLNSYPKTEFEKGISIIVDGPEYGKCWFLSEYEKERGVMRDRCNGRENCFGTCE